MNKEIQNIFNQFNDLYKKYESDEITKEEYKNLLVSVNQELHNYLLKDKKKELPLPVNTIYYTVDIDGEEIHIIKNPNTNQMSNGFTKEQAIEKYNLGKTFDATEYEEELNDFSL